MNQEKTIGLRRSFCLNSSLVIATLILGAPSSLAEGVPHVSEEHGVLGEVSLTTHNHFHPQKNTATETEEEPLDFSDTGRSGQQTAGDNRPRQPCSDVALPLTALVPSSNYGRTIATHPQLWFYVPYGTQDISKIEFVIQDAERNDISRQVWQPQTVPGYLRAGLPETEPALETNKSYRWYLKVYCQDDDRTAPLFVQGWIDKIAPKQSWASLESGLPKQEGLIATSTDLERLSLESHDETNDVGSPVTEQASAQTTHIFYAHKKLWFDAIDSLLNSYLTSPENPQIAEDWEKLIRAKGVDLELPPLENTNLFISN
ncbi:protein of unknown function (DUF928) [Xenococcus sp. PCC 7305]|uniref:DUF928 domain-containing protein n=1 Tax=Xenococcus sp. PCC 7305 TaxID=102125 RepID=UPI0002ACDC01|nr:DUF928 domain-containing protein [Xenococcus sp. PCC 7305]ELS00901.1 protein of unknown function (DUF928) [Xenococcus sp. PCC 7305]